ncbi:hypothetical protein [Deinococcus wulumuqiensis]|uniref:hypothetical protein n=1 Tax=Deinococcus wulumuqiensis TaxID=980427 RepID=UPI00242CB89D|nr:hypothetical protein [Deinococcus wulumuqiensis]
MKPIPYVSHARRQEIVSLPLVAVLPSGEERPARVQGAFLDFPIIHVEGFGRSEYCWPTVDHFAQQGRFPFDPAHI